MSVNSYADDLSSAVHYALETTHAIAVCPFHLEVTIRLGDDAAESHAIARARKLIKSDGTTWEGEALRKEFGRQLSEAADRYCPHCALSGGPLAIYGAADVNPFSAGSDLEHQKATPWLHDEPEFPCEGCGDLVVLEKAKLLGEIRRLIGRKRLVKRFMKQAKVGYTS
ncbi:hypothetical protein [Bradyrhizobium sp. ARR65]|uniref:hypothetical protein n=1 Tax=Bradyrhizobium sp. ARR65 TaxID=1040989 RepID=UPI0004674971|nr:hypothetical protein [Bradyrhizobium sp. ARR65]